MLVVVLAALGFKGVMCRQLCGFCRRIRRRRPTRARAWRERSRLVVAAAAGNDIGKRCLYLRSPVRNSREHKANPIVQCPVAMFRCNQFSLFRLFILIMTFASFTILSLHIHVRVY